MKYVDMTQFVFQNFINAIITHYSQTRPEIKKNKFEIDDAQAEEGYQEDKWYLFTKHNIGIVNKLKN